MRIAVVGPVFPSRGGIAHYTALLCRKLRERGHTVLVVSFKRQYPRWLYPGKDNRDPGEPAAVVDGTQYLIDWLNPLSWLAAFSCMRGFGAERIVLQWWTPFWAPVWSVFGALNRLRLRAPIVFICHNVRPHDGGAGYRRAGRLVLGLADVCVVHSEAEGLDLQEMIPKASVAVRQLPVFDHLVQHRQPKADARQLLGLPSASPVFLFFGIVRSYKGLRDLVNAFPIVRRELPDALLLVVGEFWEPIRDYEQLVETVGMEQAIRMDNRYVPDQELAAYLSAADVVVAPYRSVTGSAVVQTARGFGLPVVATRTGSLVETAIADHGIELVDVGDMGALADALTACYRHSQDRAYCGEPPIDGWDAIVEVIEGSAHCAGRLAAVAH